LAHLSLKQHKRLLIFCDFDCANACTASKHGLKTITAASKRTIGGNAMARKVVTLDDLDGTSEAAETILYLCDGQYLEIDLSTQNAKKFRDALAPFVKVSRVIPAKDAGRRVLSNGSTQAITSFVPEDIDPAVVRAWAVKNGHDISEKGRVPQNIVEAWRQAQVATSSAS
jgi:hypothetical protein